MLELYHNDMSVCAQKVRMVMEQKNLTWTGTNMNLRQGEQFSPAFLKINPKGVVPVLVDDGRVFTESNAIIAYLDEKYPEVSLMPTDPGDRAIVRKWLIQIDANLHTDIATLSFVVAFRHQVALVNDTDEKLAAFLAKIPDPRRAKMLEGLIRQGYEFEGLMPSVLAYDALLQNMEAALSTSDWLVGDDLSLADIAYAPYVTRLAHLQLQHWWADKPRLTDWFARISATPGYEKGLLAWNNPMYLKLMAEKGSDAWDKFSALLSH